MDDIDYYELEARVSGLEYDVERLLTTVDSLRQRINVLENPEVDYSENEQ